MLIYELRNVPAALIVLWNVTGECGREGPCALCQIEDRIESSAGLSVIGASAIEDKLQDGVPAALGLLAQHSRVYGMLCFRIPSRRGNQVVGFDRRQCIHSSKYRHFGTRAYLLLLVLLLQCNLLQADMISDGRLFVFDADLAKGILAPTCSHLRCCCRRCERRSESSRSSNSTCSWKIRFF